MFSDLAEAVFAGDLQKAEGVLELMHASGQRSDCIRSARRRARPEASATPPLPNALVLPQPDRTAAEVFGRGGNLPPRGKLRA